MSRVAACLSRRLSLLVEPRTDGQLLAAFLADRDEPAFAELVRRHGPLVWGACRRLLPDPADAEDAFQAAFVVLIQRAHRLTAQAAVGPWLYRVAVWTARNVRRRNARGLARRRPLSTLAADPAPGPASHDLRADLDAALLALPEKYRAPLVLCHLQGWTRRDAAAAIGCPEGTLSSLLSRGLDRLRHLLRAHDPTRLLTVAGVGVPAVLATNTVRAAATGELAAAGVATSALSQLAEGVIQMFWAKKATAAAAALCVVFGTGIGVGVSVRPVPGIAADGDGPPVKVAEGTGQLVTPADLDALKAEVAAAEEVLAAAEEGVNLTRQKLDQTKAMAGKGALALADVLQDQITLTRFQENAANAKATRVSALARLRKAEEAAKAKRGLFELAVNPAPPTAVDLDVLKVELAAAEEALKAAEEAYKLARQKFELLKKQAAGGAVAKAELLDDEIALTRFRENAANALGKQQALLTRYRAAEALLKEKPAAAKPASDPNDPLAALRAQAEAAERDTIALTRKMDELKVMQARLQAEADQLAARRAGVLKKLAELKQQQDKASPPTGAPPGESVNYLFHLTVGAKGTAYRVTEYDPKGPAVGTMTFDTPAVLAKYLARVGKTAAPGTGVRVFLPKDTKWDQSQVVLDALKAAGLPVTLTQTDPAKPGATATNFEAELLKQYNAKTTPDGADAKKREALLKWLGENPPPADPNAASLFKQYADGLSKKAALSEQQKQDAEAAKLRADIEALTRQLKDLQSKPADPATQIPPAPCRSLAGPT